MRSATTVQSITASAMIAACYVVMTYVSSLFGMSSGTIQVRLSEALCILPYFTFSAIPGLTIGCFLANMLTGGVVLDLIFGTVATFLGATGAYLLRDYKYLVPVPTIIINSVIIPSVLIYGYGADAPYSYLVVTVGIGELISCGIIGTIFLQALLKVSFFRKLRSMSLKGDL